MRQAFSVLPDLEKADLPPSAKPKRRRKLWRWIIPGLVLAGLFWLNGPGLRSIAPRVAARYLEKAGLRGDFKIKGSLIGGLSFADLTIEGDGALARLTIDQVTPEYEWRGLVKGQLKGLEIDGIHADIVLGLEKPDEPGKPPLDLKKLVETLRTVRSRVLPVELDLKNITVAATRDGGSWLALAGSRISHQRGSDSIDLELGVITDAEGREWPGRKSTLVWGPDRLTLAQLDPYPGVGVRDFAMQLPAGGEPSLETRVLLDGAVFQLSTSPGFSSARLDLREGKLPVAETAKRFGAAIPATAMLTSLAIELEGILPDPKAATGTVRLLLENLTWQDWQSPELALDATLAADQATVAARGIIFGSAYAVDATAPVRRGDTSFELGDAAGKFTIADVPQLLRELAAKVPAIDPEVPVPPSVVDGNFTVAFTANQPRTAAAELILQPADPMLAAPLAVSARWARDEPISGSLTSDGLKASGTYQPQLATYQATLALDGFTSARIDRWLAIARVKPGGVADLSGNWSGGGELKTGRHRGELALAEGAWKREAQSPVMASGSIRYDWPGTVEASGLRVRMDDQTVALEAVLAAGSLELKRLLWTAGKDDLAEASARVPVPEDFSKWRETLARDARPLAVSIQSKVLSLALLKPWLPALEQLDPRSTGQLGIEISGTFAEPVIDAKLEARDLRSPAQPKLPPADLKLTLAARDGQAVLDGSATAPDFPAAVLRAALPFRPAVWAENPGAFMEEPLAARVDLPRLDLSRFTSLVPAAETISGSVTGNVDATGKVGKPELKGLISLTGAGVKMKDDKIPELRNIAATVDLAFDRIVLRNLDSKVAGGTLNGEGSLVIANGTLGPLDLRLRGNHLPILRNELLILRANADLRLQGVWPQAALTGTVGLVDSIFYRDIELLPIGMPFTGPAAAAVPKIDPPKRDGGAIPGPFGAWTLDVTASTQEPLLVRGNFANGDITGRVRIGGTLGAPAPDGVLTIREFRASLPFSTLEVRSGTANFTPASGFDPILEIRGTAQPRPYQVTVYAYGRASDPQLVLTSNPPLPENEIMTLLATGTTTSGLEDPQAASSRALQLLVEELRRGRFRFGKRLRPVLGLLDRVDFSLAEADPYSSESFSTATLSITDRWFLSAGVGASGESRALAIWRLSFR